MPLPRLNRLIPATALLALLVGSASAQQPAPPRDAQLDRIEQKLDDVLKRLGAGGAPPAQTEKTPESENPTNYRPGALAIVHAAPASARLLSDVPVDSIGGFTYSGGPIALHDLNSRGVNFSGLAGIELQGWLKVKQAGRMQFVADLHGTLAPNVFVPPECLLQIWLEDRLVGPERATLAPDKNRDAKASMLIGAKVEPGLYKFRLWTVCAAVQNPNAARVTVDLLIKPPGDLNLRGVSGDELLHRPG
jgi:hypothetical protein